MCACGESPFCKADELCISSKCVKPESIIPNCAWAVPNEAYTQAECLLCHYGLELNADKSQCICGSGAIPY